MVVTLVIDVWLKLAVRVDGNKIERNILLSQEKSDPGEILKLFSKIEKLCKDVKSTK